ncbi:hypothetical protein [Gordonia sp. N1V]|uniref:hypothetical protein n=1 Tax=Gordonia sp. N1V TaxID=3034163 RepID=UPI0023E2DF80|nr:hypothetical protein [Gordonia sp. N1V]MDF3281820.1 hypothetical protein [Gordonia sp. N1V]
MTLTSDRSEAGTGTDRHSVGYGFPPRAALSVAAVLAVVLLLLDIAAAVDLDVAGAGVRAVLVFAGVLTLPGLPLVIALRIPGRALSAILAAAISLSVTVLAAQTTMIAEWWSPLRTQAILMVATLAVCLWTWRTLPAATRSGTWRLGRRTWTRSRARSLVALAVALALFVVSAESLDVLRVGRFGVIAGVDAYFFVGLALLAVVIVAALGARRLDPLVLSVSTVLAVVYNGMLVGAATGETSIPTSFVHRGFISILAQGHALPDQIDARFSWAGFFSMAAHVQTAAGLPDVTGVLVWAPLVSGVVMSFGVYAIAIAVTGRARLAWMSVLLYHGFNWYQQDYFAPQAMALIGYTAILATLLWQLRRAPLPDLGQGRIQRVLTAFRRTPGRVPGIGAGRTLALEAILVVIVAAGTVSHQMTPILTIVALAAFAATGTTRYRTLWLAAGLIFAAWFSYGATDFWLGHLQSLVEEVGKVGQSVEAGVGDRLSGDPTYTRMQYLRMMASGGFALVGLIGWFVWRTKRTRLIAGLLCAAPFLLVALQSYGGEMIIRCFLLASPVLAPFVALTLAWVGHRIDMARRRRPGSSRLTVLTSMVLCVAVFAVGVLETTNRGLNTAFEASTRDEVVLTDEFMATIPPDSLVMSFSHAPHSVGIRRTLDPHGPKFAFIDSYPCLNNIALCTEQRDPDFVYITNQGIQMLVLQYGQDPSWLRQQIDEVVDTGRFRVTVNTPSVQILRNVKNGPTS